MRALDDIVQQGKARYVGVSNFRLSQLEACMKLRRIDVVQYGWNMFDRRMQREIFPWCTANGVGVMAYGSLAYGMLSRRVPCRHAVRRDRLALEARHSRRRSTCSEPCSVRTISRATCARSRRLKALAAKYGKTVAAIRAALDAQQHRRSTTGLVGFRRPAEVEENLGALGFYDHRRRTWRRSTRSLRATTSSPNRPAGWRTIPPPEAKTRNQRRTSPCRSNVSPP